MRIINADCGVLWLMECGTVKCVLVKCGGILECGIVKCVLVKYGIVKCGGML